MKIKIWAFFLTIFYVLRYGLSGAIKKVEEEHKVRKRLWKEYINREHERLMEEYDRGYEQAEKDC